MWRCNDTKSVKTTSLPSYDEPSLDDMYTMYGARDPSAVGSRRANKPIAEDTEPNRWPPVDVDRPLMTEYVAFRPLRDIRFRQLCMSMSR